MNRYNKYSTQVVQNELLEKGILLLKYANKDEYVYYNKISKLFVKGSKAIVEIEVSRDLNSLFKIVENAFKANKRNNYNSNFISYEMFNIPLIIQKGIFPSKDKFIKNNDGSYHENTFDFTSYMIQETNDSLDKYSNLDSKTLKFLNTITKNHNPQSIAIFLSKMIYEPDGTGVLMLIGDKNISLIFQKNILNPIYGTNVCFLTEEKLLHSNMDDLLENYTIFYVNCIPQSEDGKKRILPITPQLLELYKSIPKDDSEYLFASPVTGKPYVSIYNSWNSARTKAGLKDVRIHDLRHSFASFLVNSGRSLYEVQTLLGHSTSTMTQRYAHLSNESLMSAASCAGDLMAG